MASIFSKIINREIPAYIVAEDNNFIAFLDINPLAEGHTLVVPKQEIDYIFELPDQDIAQLFVFAKRVAQSIERVVPCKRIGLSVIGLEVPHSHIHLVPLNAVNDINFAKPKLDFSREQYLALAKKIKDAFK
ncbi:MAG: HIT family protein [Flammeovirgaceae bacterium]|jgi:histidine triad (HIT) family protein|nr:HIT family protein [Flammeovirgaceae bacterium]